MTNMGYGVKPSELCSIHLNSCHGEIHQEVAYIKRHGFTSAHLGHLRFGQFVPEHLKGRHEELAHELDHRAKQSRSRGGHQSDLEIVNSIDVELFGFPLKALELYQRNVFSCKDCKCLED